MSAHEAVFAQMPGPILVVAAHPDDIEVHMGGTVAWLVQLGRRVRYVLATSGNRGTANPTVSMEELGESREAEQRRAADVLGVTDLVFLRHDDGDLAFLMPRLREEVVREIRTFQPQTVFTLDPFPGDGSHDACSIYPDHTTIGRITFEAAFVCAPGPLFYPEQAQVGLAPHKPAVLYLAMTGNPNVFVDIAPIWQQKWAAIRQHRTQGRDAAPMEGFFQRIAQEIGQRVTPPLELAENFRRLLPT